MVAADDVVDWEDRTFYLVGGGMCVPGGSPRGYWDAIHLVGLAFQGGPWQEWWASAAQPPCELFFWLGRDKPQVAVRRYARMVRVTCDRPWSSGQPDPGPDAALLDARAVVKTLRARFALASPPVLLLQQD